MADKEQIIIDGINLSNIRLYLETGHRASISTKEFEKILDLLEEKTQECEKYESYYELYRQKQRVIKNVHAVVNSHPKYGVELTNTGVIDKDERLSTLEVDEQIKLIFDETLKECEELKKERITLTNKNNRLTEELNRTKLLLEGKNTQYNTKVEEFNELKRQYKLSCLDCEYKNTKADVDRYRKTLEEIENYTRKQFCDNCEDIDSTEYSCHCEYCEYQEYFDIINKVKGEKK